MRGNLKAEEFALLRHGGETEKKHRFMQKMRRQRRKMLVRKHEVPYVDILTR